MSTITVGWMVDIVEKKAQDEENDDFSPAELIGYYNLALKTIVSLVNRAYTIEANVLLASGILQSLPSDGLLLVDIPINMGVAPGTTPGEAITEADFLALKTLCPAWAAETATAAIEQFVRIPGMDASFYCVPPSLGTGYVKMLYVATPPTTTYDAAGAWESEKIPLSDEFVPAIPDCMLMHAYDDDTDTPGDESRSNKYYQRVLQFLGLKEQQVSGRK